MSLLARIAIGFAILRGVMLAVLTVPWVLQKTRHPDATKSERSLVWMVGSRTILLGIAILLLSFGGRWEALAWALLCDGVLQLFDAIQAMALRKSALAVLPAILCAVDGSAAVVLMTQ